MQSHIFKQILIQLSGDELLEKRSSSEVSISVVYNCRIRRIVKKVLAIGPFGSPRTLADVRVPSDHPLFHPEGRMLLLRNAWQR
jgi:hypothetical protein